MKPLRHPDSEPDDDAALSPERQAELLRFSELFFFAYRDFTGDPDEILTGIGFGRAHHRVLHFVSRQPGLRVADLLEILKITKQSLGRVLRQLVDTGYIRQEPGSTDRRERLLYPTEAGEALANRLAAPQLIRFSQALKAAGPGAEALVERFLKAMANGDAPAQILAMIAQQADTLASPPDSASPSALKEQEAAASELSGAAAGKH